MHRIDTEGHDEGLFRDGNPQIGQQGTILAADWLNDIQENVAGVIEGAGLALEKGNHDQLRLALQALIGAATPPGTISMFGGPEAPAGYLECDGAVVDRAAYPGLFGQIGTFHNTGAETAAQFRLPDLRGEFVRGWDHGKGTDAGRALGSGQGESHPVTSLSSSGGAGTYRYDPLEDASDAYFTLSTGGQEVRPRNVALMFVIKT